MKRLLPILIFLFSIQTIFAANRYWVGGSGTWDASTTTNWDSISGGIGGASVPTSSDNVFFDLNSFNGAGQTVTISADVNCANLVWTGATNNPTLSFTYGIDINIYGSLTLISAMTYTQNGSLYFKSTVAGKTITTAGKTIANIYFDGVGGSWTLQDAFTSDTDGFYVQNGTVNTNGQSVSGTPFINVYGGTLNLGASTVAAFDFEVSGGTLNCNSAILSGYIMTVTSGTLNFGTSTINITGSSIGHAEMDVSATATLTGTSTINFTGANNDSEQPIEIYTGGLTYNTITLPSSGNIAVRMYEGGTITNAFSLPNKTLLLLESGSTFTFSSTVTASSSCSTYPIIASITGGSAATISTGVAQNWSYIQLKDITKTGVGSITCDYCINAGTNTSISFTNTYVPKTLYWRGTGTGDGNWGTGTNWTANADGSSSGNTCVPTLADNVVFDGFSFDGASKTVTVDNIVAFANMNWTGATNTPTFNNPQYSGYTMITSGNITLISGIGWTNGGELILCGSGNQLITCGGKVLTLEKATFTGSGTYYLEADASVGTVNLLSGTLDVQNQAGTTVYNLNIIDDWIKLGGTFQPRSDASKYVNFYSTGYSTIYNSTTFYNLKVNKSSSTYDASPASGVTVTISNDLLITGGEYENGWSDVITNVSGTSTVNCATCLLTVSSGTFNYQSNSTTGFSIQAGTVRASGGTLNIGVLGAQTTTVLNVGNASGTGDAIFWVSGGTVNIMDQLWVKSDGVFRVSGGTVDIKKNSTNAGTAGIAKWLMDASSEFRQTGGTINVNGSSDDNVTNAISFNTSATFTAGNITSGTVVLKSNYGSYNYPVDFGGKTLYNLTVNQASRTFKQVSNSVTLKGAFTITAGTYDANGQTMSVAGNWVNNSTYTHNNSSVTFNGTTTISGSSTNTFYDITISGALTGPSSGTINMAHNWANNGTYTHNSGTVVFNGTSTVSGSSTTSFNNVTVSSTMTAHATAMNVAGNWVNNGTFNHNSGLITFNGTTTLSGSSISSLNAVTISGILTGVSSANYNVAGNWINNGTYNHNSGTVTFNGTTTLSGSSTSSFNNATITGTLTGVSSGNFNVAGNWINTAGTFNHNNGTVTFNGSSTLTTGGNGATKKFYNLTLNGTSATLDGNIDIDNHFTLTSGTWSTSGSNYSMNIGGDFVTSGGTFNANASTTTFDGTATQVVNVTSVGGSTPRDANITFYNVIIDGSDVKVYYNKTNDRLINTNDVTINNGKSIKLLGV